MACEVDAEAVRVWAEDTTASHGADALLAALQAGSHLAKVIDNDTLYSDVVLMISVVRWFGEVNGVHATSEPVDPVVSKRWVGEPMRFSKRVRFMLRRRRLA